MPLTVCRRLKLNEQYKYQPEYYKMERDRMRYSKKKRHTNSEQKSNNSFLIQVIGLSGNDWQTFICRQNSITGSDFIDYKVVNNYKSLRIDLKHVEIQRTMSDTYTNFVRWRSHTHTKSLKCKMENAESNTFVGRCHGHRFRWRSSTNFLFVCWRADDSVQAEKLLLLLTSREWLELTHTKHFVSVNKLLFYCTCEWIAFSLLNAHHGHNMRVFVCIYLLGIGFSLVGGLLHFVRSLASLI